MKAHPLLLLQSALGNQVVSRIVQRDGETPAAKTPLQSAQELVAEAPANAKDRAAWILKAAEQGFATFNTTKAKQNLEDIRDGKKVEKLDPEKAGYDVPILTIEVGLVKKTAQRWIAAKGEGDKPSIQFGSMIRSSSADVHGQGKAIDINNLAMTTSVEATVQILDDLDQALHTSYGLGMPFQGDFFDPADEITQKKAAAEKAASQAGQTTASVTDALDKFASHVYQTTGAKNEGGSWEWTKPEIQKAGGAYQQLKSQKLKDTLAKRRKDGLSFTIFPDNDNHLHLDAR